MWMWMWMVSAPECRDSGIHSSLFNVAYRAWNNASTCCNCFIQLIRDCHSRNKRAQEVSPGLKNSSIPTCFPHGHLFPSRPPLTPQSSIADRRFFPPLSPEPEISRSRITPKHPCLVLSAATVAFYPSLVGVPAVGARLTPYPLLWGQYGMVHYRPPASPIDWSNRTTNLLFLHRRSSRYPSGTETTECRDINRGDCSRDQYKSTAPALITRYSFGLRTVTPCICGRNSLWLRSHRRSTLRLASTWWISAAMAGPSAVKR